jgi:hypothetical protein
MKRISRLYILASFSIMAQAWLATAPPLLAQNVQVTSASPNSATQGTTNLDVIVGGSGFKHGAKASWFVTGSTNPGGVTVNSTTVNNASQLTANITVSSAATTGSYDIEVQNSDGRTGKGTGLFAIDNDPSSASCNFNVTSVLYNTDSNNVPLQYQSDGLGPYTTSTKGNNSVSSIIQKSCSWQLDTTGSTTRGIVLTLAYPDASGTKPPFVGPQEVKGVFHTTCQDYAPNNGLNFGTMTYVGQTLPCPLHFVFTYNGVTYNLSLAPPNWPGTSLMQVTCAGVNGGLCNSWTVQPDPATSVINPATNQLSSIGELFVPSCSGCITGTGLGTFLVSYSFLIHQ